MSIQKCVVSGLSWSIVCLCHESAWACGNSMIVRDHGLTSFARLFASPTSFVALACVLCSAGLVLAWKLASVDARKQKLWRAFKLASGLSAGLVFASMSMHAMLDGKLGYSLAFVLFVALVVPLHILGKKPKAGDATPTSMTEWKVSMASCAVFLTIAVPMLVLHLVAVKETNPWSSPPQVQSQITF